MNNVKFRAFDTNTKRWFDDCEIYSGGEWLGVYYKDGVESTINPCTSSVLNQFTGLSDKNGKEIYEGDILRQRLSGTSPYDSFDIDTCWGEIRIGSVQFNEKIGAFFWEYGKTSSCIDSGFVEIIGNIYENPELLNK